ncbi:hypothetical protein CEXT_179611 [Caerostris extrusa]|uniref:Uncharacterized protein n=1 Tax=Caerostris extrusa TaxID=172846 RepID=A0AAV4XUL7_CAEEX|nr:hypothetical protein CEXT_179611 [Caerostris extrusa]
MPRHNHILQRKLANFYMHGFTQDYCIPRRLFPVPVNSYIYLYFDTLESVQALSPDNVKRLSFIPGFIHDIKLHHDKTSFPEDCNSSLLMFDLAAVSKW